MIKVKNLIAYKILDANGYWAIEAKIVLSTKTIVKASLPLVTNVLTDLADNLKLANKILKQINQFILPNLIDLEVEEDFALVIDELLKQLKIKHKTLTSQTSLLISILSARVGAKVSKVKLYKYINKIYNLNQINYKLPTPIFTMFNGGSFADTNLDFEEYLLIPLSKNKTSFAQKISNASKVFYQLAGILQEAGLDTDTGSEGGYAPNVSSSIKILEFMTQAITEIGFIPGKDMGIGVDIGSHHLYDSETGKYIFKLDRTQLINDTLINLYRDWLEQYPIIYLEDGLSANDISGWKSLTNQLRQSTIIAGDRLFNNDLRKLRESLKDGLANAVVIRLAELERLHDLVEFVKLAKRHNYQIIIANSYGETTDTLLADLSVAIGADYIKAGSLARGERNIKYNRLLEIAQNLNN